MGIKLKRSAVANKVPTTADLELGEIAVNTYDGKVYIKKDNGTASIVEVGGSPTVADGSITTAKIANGAVTSDKIANNAVTNDDLAQVATATLKGRVSAGTGNVQDLTASQGRSVLGLGTMATQNASSVAITGGTISGATINPSPGDSITTGRTLSAPSYIGTAGNYLKTDYPALAGMPQFNLDGTSFISRNTATLYYTNFSLYVGSTLLIAGANGLSARSTNHGATFSSSMYMDGIEVRDIASDGVSTVLAAGRYSDTVAISRSTDSGQTWSRAGITFPATIGSSSMLLSIGYGNGVWIATGYRYSPTYFYFVMRSTDNGSNWTIVRSATSGNGQGEFQRSPTYGNGVWIVPSNYTSSGGYLRSTDNGLTWVIVGSNSLGSNRMSFFKNGLWLGGSSNYLLRSTDNFNTWSFVTLPSGAQVSNGLAMTDDGILVAVGGTSQFFRSTDLGLTWSTVTVTNANSSYVEPIFGGGVINVFYNNNGTSIFYSTTSTQINIPSSFAGGGKYVYTGQ